MGTGVNSDLKIAGHCPTDLDSDVLDIVKTETQKALDAILFKYGASNTEFRVTNDGKVYILELNPRMPGNFSNVLMQLYNGYDYVKGVIDVALGQFEEPVITETKHSGIYFLTKHTEWVRKVIENRKNDPDIIYHKIYNSELHDFQSTLDKGGYFMYQSDRRRRWGEKN